MNDVQTDAWGGKKIRAAIIEDELPAARLLQGMLAELRPQWDILLLPGTVEDAVQWFATHPHPDILFLDIQLTDGLSFYFIEQARPESMIVFTTAYDEYAVRAFTVNSIDYLLKPVRRERLADSLEKFERLTAPRIREQNERMDMQELLRMLADRARTSSTCRSRSWKSSSTRAVSSASAASSSFRLIASATSSLTSTTRWWCTSRLPLTAAFR